MRFSVQVIRVYHVDAPDEAAMAAMNSLEIAEYGDLKDVTVDYIEPIDDDGPLWDENAAICACGGTGYVPGIVDDERCPHHGDSE